MEGPSAGDVRRAVRMRSEPAPHYTMGGLWVDYHLMSTIPGLFVLGEANFSDHGANRLGASALMQGLADGVFISPRPVTPWTAGSPHPAAGPDPPACRPPPAPHALGPSALRSGGGVRGAGWAGRRVPSPWSFMPSWGGMGGRSWPWPPGWPAS